MSALDCNAVCENSVKYYAVWENSDAMQTQHLFWKNSFGEVCEIAAHSSFGRHVLFVFKCKVFPWLG